MVTVCSFDFANEAMFAEQTKKSADLAGLAALFAPARRRAEQQFPHVAVAEAVECELATQQDFDQLSIVAGERVETAETPAFADHGSRDRIRHSPQRNCGVDGGECLQVTCVG